MEICYDDPPHLCYDDQCREGAGKVPGSMREGGGNRLGWWRRVLVCMPK